MIVPKSELMFKNAVNSGTPIWTTRTGSPDAEPDSRRQAVRMVGAEFHSAVRTEVTPLGQSLNIEIPWKNSV
jgi:hypothetical protein